MRDPTFLRRVAIENYKSIGKCHVELGPLTFLVGPNGSGKSNFLDALRFVADSLAHSLEHAVRDRGGIDQVRRRSGGHPRHFGIRLEYRTSDGVGGVYGFKIGAREKGGFRVQEEECVCGPAEFRVREGEVNVWRGAGSERWPPATADRLLLVHAAGLPAFFPAYWVLSQMGFYNLNPDRIRDLQPPDPGELLHRDGGNIAGVLDRLAKHDATAKERIEAYLARVVAEIAGVDVKTLGPKETLEFRQRVAGQAHPWRFLASSMSDGTLRAVGVLTALFQARNGASRKVPLIGIEEPEIALHPAAAGVLFDALHEASRSLQVLVTSHSPDLLDRKEIAPDQILAALSENGETEIARMDSAGRQTLRDHLYSAGELLRMNQLRPDPDEIARARKLRLFD